MMYLVITRGDAVSPVPVGVCDDPEIIRLAVRSAWRRAQELVLSLEDSDPVTADAAAATVRHLTRAARDAESDGGAP